MATYKVIQDIEAEDKFVGPLTLKQFIFGAIFVVSGYISFLLITKHVWFISVPLWPVMIAAGFLAFPWGRDQPTEVWLLAKVRFFFKPRLRIWDQSGVQDMVTITVPKKVVENFGDNLSQTEVKSRLHALADTIDSRGWAVKNMNINMYAQPGYAPSISDSDRLVGVSTLPAEIPIIDIQPADDIMDEHSNPLAQHMEQMIAASAQSHRVEMLDHMDEIREKQTVQATEKSQPAPSTGQDLWFVDESTASQAPTAYTTFSAKEVPPTSSKPVATLANTPLSADEKALLEKVHKDKSDEPKHSSYGHMRVLEPLSSKRKTHTKKQASTSVSTPDPDIISLANNNDRNVDSLAREINQNRKQEPPKDEVVISLR